MPTYRTVRDKQEAGRGGASEQHAPGDGALAALRAHGQAGAAGGAGGRAAARHDRAGGPREGQGGRHGGVGVVPGA